ncbi:MAG: PAS domain-containing protein [Anaerolineales bacterium]|nr:PAS domain-containing protein [Anaerolineales bacterium]
MNDLTFDKPVLDSKKVYGWVWECDSHGNYRFCSPEVIDALGIPPDEFVGQPLTEFALHDSSAKNLKQALTSKRHPFEIDLQYHMRHQESKTIKLYIMRMPSNNGYQPGWRGFAQLVENDSPNNNK